MSHPAEDHGLAPCVQEDHSEDAGSGSGVGRAEDEGNIVKTSRANVRAADSFFEGLLKDPEIRFHYEEERARTMLAAAVRAARARAKLTQAQLAKKIGTSQSVIARLESGSDRRMPSLSLLARIAAACHGELELGFRFKKAA